MKDMVLSMALSANTKKVTKFLHTQSPHLGAVSKFKHFDTDFDPCHSLSIEMEQSVILASHFDLEENRQEDLQVLTLRSNLREALEPRRARSEDA